MKKALSFAVALGLVAGMASTAAANDIVDFHGDARWRGVNIVDADADSATPDRKTQMDQRYRLVANVNVNEDLMVGLRINMYEGPLSTKDNYSQTNVDRAYMKIKMLGGTYLIGRQDASWGNKFFGWGGTTDRIKGIYKSGDLTYGGYLQQTQESLAAGGTGVNGDDSETYAAFVIGKAGDTKWGVLANYNVNHSGAGTTGQTLDIFMNTKAGAANIMSEFFYGGGDAGVGANPDGDALYGGFVGAQMDVADGVSAKGLIAYYADNQGAVGAGRSCDNDFAPTLLIGSCQETAIGEFGASTIADDETMLVTAGVDVKINDKLSVGALAAYSVLSDELDVDATEIDLTARYVLAKGVTYKIGVAYGMVDGLATDDEVIAVGNSISVKF